MAVCVPAQWKDLPYADCTWETAQDIFAAGGQDCVDEFQARLHCSDICRICMFVKCLGRINTPKLDFVLKILTMSQARSLRNAVAR